jgi:hypothetical protein
MEEFDNYILVAAPYGLGDCWIWQGAKTSAGYAFPSVDGEHILLHRYSWEKAHGRKIPQGKFVRHKCDIRACINPSHLIIGTQRDNVMDMVKRGRHGNSIKSAQSCRRGHPRTPANTQTFIRKDRGSLERRCRVCRRVDAVKTSIPSNLVAMSSSNM